MKFLERSRSQRKDSGLGRRKDRDVPEQPAINETNNEYHEKQLKAPVAPSRRSMQRPRTANRAMDRSKELQIPGRTIEITSDDATFSFPTPSPRLPHSATFPHRGSGIGLAIGSPSHAPVRSFTSDHVATRAMYQAPPAREPPGIPQQADALEQRPVLRKQKSAWKTFGGLFQKRPAKQIVQEPFYKVQLSEPEAGFEAASEAVHSPALLTPPPDLVQTPTSISSHHSRTPSLSRGIARQLYRAECDRAQFEKVLPNIQGTMSRGVKGDDRRSRVSEDMFRSNPPSRTDSPLSLTEGVATPRLNVNIPNVEMERYSVMFEKLLKPTQQSLLERRNGTLKKLKSVKIPEEPKKLKVIETEPRGSNKTSTSASPKQIMRSPSLPVFPLARTKISTGSPEAPVTALHRPRPLQRSKTAPPGAVSPARATFVKSTTAPASPEPNSPLWSEASLPPTPTSSDRQTFISCDDNGDFALVSHDPMPLVPRLGEPSWDMMTSKAARLEDEPYPRVRSPEDLDRQIVQVSVARQVSVSRARDKVQRPFISKQPLKPRVVELKNRKSTVVLIENA